MLTASCDWCTRGVDCQHLDKEKSEIVHKYLVNKKSFIPFNNSIIVCEQECKYFTVTAMTEYKNCYGRWTEMSAILRSPVPNYDDSIVQ